MSDKKNPEEQTIDERLQAAGCPIEKIRSDNDELLTLAWRDRLAVARPMTTGEFDLLAANTAKLGARRASASLLRAVVLWPAREELDALLDRYPALALTWASAIAAEAGAAQDVVAGKL